MRQFFTQEGGPPQVKTLRSYGRGAKYGKIIQNFIDENRHIKNQSLSESLQTIGIDLADDRSRIFFDRFPPKA